MKQIGKHSDHGESLIREKFKKNEKRVILKDTKKLSANSIKGIVFASMGKQFLVQPENQKSEFIECSYGATIESRNTNSSIIAVGDTVHFVHNQDTKQNSNLTGSIIKVEERYSSLSRKTVGLESEQVIAANADQLLIIMSAANPFYNKRLIDRFLIAAEQGNLHVALCINKMDLVDEKAVKKDLKIYKKLGVTLFFISASNDINLAKLNKHLKNKVTILAGPSGVGKSTIINKLFGLELQKISEISERTTKGTHTTSFSKMFDLPKGGKIIDTPGLRELNIWNVGKEELPFFFHDFDEYFLNCKYLPCSHTHEPECSVVSAVEKGKISLERYESYLNILETVE